MPHILISEQKAHTVCLDGGLHPREEESREHPHLSPAPAALPALILKVIQTDPPAQQ